MWKLVDVQIIYKKLYQRELVTSDCFFVIRTNSGVQIFRNDEKARQRHLSKMYTLVVTMNWNRFRKIFRIRFCIFYNRSELSHWRASAGIDVMESSSNSFVIEKFFANWESFFFYELGSMFCFCGKWFGKFQFVIHCDLGLFRGFFSKT